MPEIICHETLNGCPPGAIQYSRAGRASPQDISILRAPFQLGRYSPEIRAEGLYIFLMVAGNKNTSSERFFYFAISFAGS
jgi:hypothetical protein